MRPGRLADPLSIGPLSAPRGVCDRSSGLRTEIADKARDTRRPSLPGNTRTARRRFTVRVGVRFGPVNCDVNGKRTWFLTLYCDTRAHRFSTHERNANDFR